MTEDSRGVCLVTQPERGQTGKGHAHDLADIIAPITNVSILTANLPSEASLRTEHEVVEYSSRGTGEHVLVEVWRFLLNQVRLCLSLRQREECIMLFFGTTSYVVPIIVSRVLGKTVIVLPRGDVPLSLRLRWERSLPNRVARELASLVGRLEKVSYYLADAIVTYTPAMASQLGLDRYEEKLYTNGARFVDTDQFDVRVPFEKRDRTVGFVGRLDVEKRVPELVAAVKELPENIKFIFVGDGDYRSLLESELADEIESGQVEVVGWVNREEIPEQLNRLQLLVAPSHPTEGLPTVILEAMACGTPVLATPVSGVPDVVRDGETGFLIERVDRLETVEKIANITHQEDLSEISKNAQELISIEYTFEAAVDRYTKIFNQI